MGDPRGGRFHWPWTRPGENEQRQAEEASLVHKDSRKPTKPAVPALHGWRIVLLSWFNILLVFLPASWILDSLLQNSHRLTFASCTLAMMPLVRLHDLSTRELAVRIGGSRTGLLNASLSNIVEVVIATTALRKCQLRIVQSSLVGSMLSKLLLVLGMCFFGGGLRFSEQGFDPTATGVHSSLLSISVAAVLMPAAYHFSMSGGSGAASAEQKEDILKMSHGVAVVLLVTYSAYLVFQLWSHQHLYKDSKTVPSTPHAIKHMPNMKRISSRLDLGTFREKSSRSSSCQSSPSRLTRSVSNLPNLIYHGSASSSPYSSASDISLPLTTHGSGSSTVAYVYAKDRPTEAPASGGTVKLVMDRRDTDFDGFVARVAQFDENTAAGDSPTQRLQIPEVTQEPLKGGVPAGTPEPRLSWQLNLALLVVVTVLVAVNAEWLVESMDGLSEDISKEWIALILLPLVECIAECVTAINVSVHDQLTLSISVAVGSTIQVALFVIPFMVILGWIMGKPLALLFDPFESVVLYISVNTMGYVVADGKSNWLEGAILICLYLIIAVSFWFYPGSTFSSTLAVCVKDPTA
ncbi:hypothetical protein FA95DRAFT_1556468 [Auriscalpium vulgare]|uniref:Uncharacterized protein n=1 Tax=Auriscalpium vulgare TaxID=40419 RepID=A0ACB8S0F3_9AGAM|nr:hypothetical protein FA95DRAFT_1556468 [Auriscalpium vulgare]